MNVCAAVQANRNSVDAIDLAKAAPVCFVGFAGRLHPSTAMSEVYGRSQKSTCPFSFPHLAECVRVTQCHLTVCNTPGDDNAKLQTIRHTMYREKSSINKAFQAERRYNTQQTHKLGCISFSNYCKCIRNSGKSVAEVTNGVGIKWL